MQRRVLRSLTLRSCMSKLRSAFISCGGGLPAFPPPAAPPPASSSSSSAASPSPTSASAVAIRLQSCAGDGTDAEGPKAKPVLVVGTDLRALITI